MAFEPVAFPSPSRPEEGQPFSIYLQLEEGTQADLEVVAKSSLALIAALKDVVEFADPLMDLKITIQNGEEGSLRLNTFLTLFGRGEESRKTRQTALNWLLGGVTMFLLEATAGHYYENFLSWIDERVIEAVTEGEDPDTVEAIAQECKAILDGAMHNELAARHVRRFFEELRDDPNIVGVGVSADHQTLPEIIIPRAEFYARSKAEPIPEENTKRERVERMTVLLVQPRLLGDEKAWRFSAGGLEFAAKVTDRRFIEETLSGKNPIPLVEGVYLDVDLRLDEKKENGVWVVKHRSVQHVHGVEGGKIQGSLLGPV